VRAGHRRPVHQLSGKKHIRNRFDETPIRTKTLVTIISLKFIYKFSPPTQHRYINLSEYCKQ
jgi:hypothetical protein